MSKEGRVKGAIGWGFAFGAVVLAAVVATTAQVLRWAPPDDAPKDLFCGALAGLLLPAASGLLAGVAAFDLLGAIATARDEDQKLLEERERKAEEKLQEYSN